EAGMAGQALLDKAGEGPWLTRLVHQASVNEFVPAPSVLPQALGDGLAESASRAPTVLPKGGIPTHGVPHEREDKPAFDRADAMRTLEGHDVHRRSGGGHCPGSPSAPALRDMQKGRCGNDNSHPQPPRLAPGTGCPPTQSKETALKDLGARQRCASVLTSS